MSNPELNRYASPLPGLVAMPAGEYDVWRDGRLLVMRKEARLPDRCVKCNAAVDRWRLKRNLHWHPPAVYLLLFLALLSCLFILIYVVVALIVRQMAKVHIGVCPKHAAQRRVLLVQAW